MCSLDEITTFFSLMLILNDCVFVFPFCHSSLFLSTHMHTIFSSGFIYYRMNQCINDIYNSTEKHIQKKGKMQSQKIALSQHFIEIHHKIKIAGEKDAMKAAETTTTSIFFLPWNDKVNILNHTPLYNLNKWIFQRWNLKWCEWFWITAIVNRRYQRT